MSDEWRISQDELEYYYSPAELYGTHRTDGNNDAFIEDDQPVYCELCDEWFDNSDIGNQHWRAMHPDPFESRYNAMD